MLHMQIHTWQIDRGDTLPYGAMLLRCNTYLYVQLL
jgi:hypothetical protein